MNSLLVRIFLWLLVQPVNPCLDELELAARNVERQHDALFGGLPVGAFFLLRDVVEPSGHRCDEGSATLLVVTDREVLRRQDLLTEEYGNEPAL